MNDQAPCAKRHADAVRLLRMYVPKDFKRVDGPVFFKQTWQVDPVPKTGIWETIGVEELDTENPLWSIRLLYSCDDAYPVNTTLKLREPLLRILFDRVQFTLTPIHDEP